MELGAQAAPTSEKGEDMSSVKSTEKWRAVETALTQIERQFGKGSIMRLGDQPEQVMSVIPTGSLAVTPRSESAASREAGSSRSSGRRRPARRPFPSRSSP